MMLDIFVFGLGVYLLYSFAFLIPFILMVRYKNFPPLYCAFAWPYYCVVGFYAIYKDVIKPLFKKPEV